MISLYPKTQIPVPKKHEYRSWRTKERKDNDVEIIVSGCQGKEIAAELRYALKKIKRKRELSYYMTIRK